MTPKNHVKEAKKILSNLKSSILSKLPLGSRFNIVDVDPENQDEKGIIVSIEYFDRKTRGDKPVLERSIDFSMVETKEDFDFNQSQFEPVIFFGEDSLEINRGKKRFKLTDLLNKELRKTIIDWIKDGKLHLDSFYISDSH